ncbi:hypothetical protein WOLCODRAFT_161898 [Wolfiporia cocos MD-104 SS10]|uniref:B30.2/SPRY domain-containing protein n=1 Tax=Wolfiporia cocos (strain MD-104) TaxID=742152 RepID=A0A2H3JUK9_WOLCO|nr:hypothetical protein WOLCODRAFT_161898 [Wolfiporia cocos MD-104 SS10]
MASFFCFGRQRKNSAGSAGFSGTLQPSDIYRPQNDATSESFRDAKAFCDQNPVEAAQNLSSSDLQRIRERGCGAWGLEVPRPSSDQVRPIQVEDCKSDTGQFLRVTTFSNPPNLGDPELCLLSDLPIIPGLYGTNGSRGVYYEVTIEQMAGMIAIGTACKPHPMWRYPGWDRLSVGLHLDDFHIFCQDPGFGQEYTSRLSSIESGHTIGCGYRFDNGSVFFTYDGEKLPDVDFDLYRPLDGREPRDVYAAIGAEGENVFEVSFGARPFKWKEGNDRAWMMDSVVGTTMPPPYEC